MGRIPWLGVVTERMLAMAWSEASVSSVIGRSGSQWQSTGAVVKASFSWENAVDSAVSKCQGIAFLQRFVRGWVISE